MHTASKLKSGHCQRLRLLSYNIQTGIATRNYRDYFTHSWKHVLPYPQRQANLDRIANLVSDFDIVGLQEVDAGSLRSGFVNQTEYLALQAHFPYWYDQTNRNLGHIAQHSIGLLSRFRPAKITEAKLPGMIPGRGALIARYGFGADSLVLVILHLALGRRARLQQLDHISGLIRECRHVVVMGDLNCKSDSEEIGWLLARTDLREPTHGLHTFPSWRPRRNIDHILVSSSLEVENVAVLNHPLSDHLPIVMEVVLPPDVKFTQPFPALTDPDLRLAAGA
jgi:endonuclease/exonuclease/phosphatase family metal-dependent hydrolase